MSVEQQHSVSWTGVGRGIGTHDLLYLSYALLLVVAVSTVHFLAPVNIVSYERDVWHHLAVINELLKSPFHAGNPHVDAPEPSRGYMPWFVGLAIFGKMFGLNALQILAWSATLSVATLLAGVHLFARVYFRHPWAPLLLLAVLFSTWLFDLNHVGFHTLSTLLFSASYPFCIVLALGFIAWWAVVKALIAPRIRLWHIGCLVLLPALMLTIHQLQGPFAIGGMLSFAAFHGEARWQRRAGIAALAIGGILLSMLWPYFNPLEYAASKDIYKFVYHSNIQWKHPLVQTGLIGLSALGIAGFYDAAGKRVRWDLVMASGGILSGILWSLWSGNWIGERLIPFLIVFLQIGLVGFFLSLMERRSLGPMTIRKIAGLLAMLTLLNVIFAGSYLVRTMRYQNGEGPAFSSDTSPDIMGVMQQVKSIVGTGKVVIAEGNAAYPVQANEMKVVSIPRLFAEVPDMVQRQSDNARFFSTAAGDAERCDIIGKYHVSAILFLPARLPADVRTHLETFGMTHVISDIALVMLRDDRESFCEMIRQAS